MDTLGGTARYMLVSIGERNPEGESILEAALAHDLVVANTWFQKTGKTPCDLQK